MSDALSQGDIINILNRVIKILTSHEGKSFEDIMADGIRPIADALDLSRVVIYRKVKTDTEEWVGQVYLWDRTIGTAPLDELLKVLPPIPAVKQWYSIALKGEFVIRKLSKMSAEEVSFANMFGIKSIMLVPVFMKGSFWGAVAFQDHVNEQDFSCHTDLLSSLAHLFADEAIKEEMRQKNSKYIEMLEHRREMSDTLNKTAITFISQNEESYDARMTIGLKLVCDMANMDRISVWRNFPTPDGLHTSQIYRWDRESGGTTKPTKGLEDVACDMFAPRWEKLLSGGEMINGPVNSMPEAAMLKSFGVVSALVVPLIVKKNFWGFVLFEDRRNERYFEDDYVEIMRSTAFLCMNTVIRAEMEREILEANKTNNLLLNEASVGVITYDENCNLIDCNDKILKMFNCEKPYLLKHFHDLSPECQPDGKNSKEKVFEVVKQMLSDGKITFEWVHQLLSGELMPCEVTLTSVKYMGSNVGIGYLYDLREYKKMLRELALRLEQQQFISEISKNFISFGDSYTLIDEALGKLGKSLNVSRMFIFYVDHEHTDSYVAYQWY
ncbi:MAG: GAF domain-containing protein, partial [Fibromonadaceae bacterium]|nr:GAF domain-containing protein [Fibromonadaceae bacterium]